MELTTKYLPYHVLKDSGYEMHWDNETMIRSLSPQRRFHAMIRGNTIDLHLDEVVKVNDKTWHLSNPFKIDGNKKKYKDTNSSRVLAELNRIKKFD